MSPFKAAAGAAAAGAAAAGVAASIEDRVLSTTPILEAFGNARTVRHDNSSRFGKYTALQFDPAGKLLGAEIHNYLLEKTRIVRQSEGERNFHVFYQVVSLALWWAPWRQACTGCVVRRGVSSPRGGGGGGGGRGGGLRAGGADG